MLPASQVSCGVRSCFIVAWRIVQSGFGTAYGVQTTGLIVVFEAFPLLHIGALSTELQAFLCRFPVTH